MLEENPEEYDKMTYTQSPWSLNDLFPALDSPEMQAAFTELEAKVSEFEALRPALMPTISVQDFLGALRKLEAIRHLSQRIDAFPQLLFAADTQNQAVVTFMGTVQDRLAAVNNRILFFSLWWKQLDQENATRLLAAAGDVRYWLEALRLFRPHTLSEPEEKIINTKNSTGVRALQTLYDSITNRYVFKLEVDGEVKELTRGELSLYIRGADPKLRAAAYQEQHRVFSQDSNILGQIFQALMRDYRSENLELRHFASPIALRNLENDIPDEVVATLLEVCKQNAPLFQRFFQLKARTLGLPKLRRYDIYAPVAETVKQYPFAEGVQMVLEAFTRFQPQVAELAQSVIEEQHLDSEIRKGKDSGAFCAGITPELTPWVHINYQGRPDDVATLAHELGHAIHDMLAAGHSILTCSPCLPLAEIASTFAEMLLLDRLFELETDPAVRRAMLFRQLDDAYATIMRQAWFAMFETQVYELVGQGAAVEQIAEAYFQNLRGQFGEALELGDEFRWEWLEIPHFVAVPFYVYAYAFAQLLVLALYQQYKVEGEAFKPRYLKILSAGGSRSPEQILTEAGIDMHSPAFWQGGFDYLSGIIDQLEKLV
jgi:oligoendopeptidase F